MWQPNGVNGQHPAKRRWWLLPLLAVLMIALGGGAGLGLRELAARADGTQQTTSTTLPTTTTSRSDEPGPPAVQLAPDAQADPRGEDIRLLLQRHFDAINSKDFAAWKATVTAERARKYLEQKWHEDYRTTQDGSFLVHRIEPVADGSMVVLLSFTSIQDPEKAPDGQSRCVRWYVSYPLATERGELRLGPGSEDTSQYGRC